jgi:hypothetical protein
MKTQFAATFRFVATLSLLLPLCVGAVDCVAPEKIETMQRKLMDVQQETLAIASEHADETQRAYTARDAVHQCQSGRTVLGDALDALALKGDRCTGEINEFNRLAMRANSLESILDARRSIIRLLDESIARSIRLACKQ